MRPFPGAPFRHIEVDAELVAAVETQAGSRGHEAATLVACYALWAELHRQAVDERDPEEVRSSRTGFDAAEDALLELLLRCREPARGASGVGRRPRSRSKLRTDVPSSGAD